MVVALHLGGYRVMGAYAVFGFYILSGYLMTLIMQVSYGYSTSGFGRYALNRFLRIFPIYWVSLIFSFALIMFFGEAATRDYHYAIYLPTNVTEFLTNVLLIVFPRGEPRLTPPAWALTVEILFYVLIGFGLSKNRPVTLVWFVLSVGFHVAALYLKAGWDNRYFSIPAASMPFATGAMIYHYRECLHEMIRRIPGGVSYFLPLLLVIAIAVNWWMGLELGMSRDVFFYSNYILCAFMVVLLSGARELPFVSKKADQWLGDFSYPIYLFHYQIGFVVVVLGALFGRTMDRPEPLLMVISLPLIFLWSWGVIVLLERPIELVRIAVKQRI